MKIKLLSTAILSIIILPLLTNISFAAITDDSACTAIGGTCMDTSLCSSGTPQSGKCPGVASNKCCVPNATDNSGTIVSTNQNSVTSITLPNPLKANNIPDLINNIVTYLIGIATIILPLVLIYAAYLLLTTGGDVEKAILARKTITYAIVGYVLILISKGVTMIIANILGAK